MVARGGDEMEVEMDESGQKYKLLFIRYISLGDEIYSMVPRVNNTVLYI